MISMEAAVCLMGQREKTSAGGKAPVNPFLVLQIVSADCAQHGTNTPNVLIFKGAAKLCLL